jgi:hypothetical protein
MIPARTRVEKSDATIPHLQPRSAPVEHQEVDGSLGREDDRKGCARLFADVDQVPGHDDGRSAVRQGLVDPPRLPLEVTDLEPVALPGDDSEGFVLVSVPTGLRIHGGARAKVRRLDLDADEISRVRTHFVSRQA